MKHLSLIATTISCIGGFLFGYDIGKYIYLNYKRFKLLIITYHYFLQKKVSFLASWPCQPFLNTLGL